MDLAAIQAGWNTAAEQDALFNILTTSYDWTIEEFYRTGQEEIDAAVEHLDDLGLTHGTARALDFGCGVGRTAQALTRHYTDVYGVDISEVMLTIAEEHNPGRCYYRHNTAPDLALFVDETFDLIYSNLVLQHMPPEYQQGYVAEFLRIIRPDGVATFGLPDGPSSPHPSRWLSMYGTPSSLVEEWVDQAGGRLADVQALGESGGWRYLRYSAVR